MQVHLSRLDIDILRQQAMESVDLDDDGESFAEEAVTRLGEEELEAIEESADAPPEEFFVRVFAAWDQEDPDGIIDVLVSMLEEIDIELTYDEVDDDETDLDDDWDDDDDLDDDDDEELEELDDTF